VLRFSLSGCAMLLLIGSAASLCAVAADAAPADAPGSMTIPSYVAQLKPLLLHEMRAEQITGALIYDPEGVVEDVTDTQSL
jgi:hypothetical protein